MTRSAKERAQVAIAARASVEQFAKRRKIETHRKTTKYSKRRTIPLAERKTLPKEWYEHGEEYWPVEKIIKERGEGQHIQYLLEWKSHPKTGEVWKPDWEPLAHVTRALLDAWEEEKAKRTETISGVDSDNRHNASPSASALQVQTRTLLGSKRRRITTRRIIDSSSDTDQPSRHLVLKNTTSSTGDYTGAEVAESPVSLVEISETRQDSFTNLIQVQLPPAPIDSADFSTLRSSHSSRPSSPPDISPRYRGSNIGLRGQPTSGIDLVCSHPRSTTTCIESSKSTATGIGESVVIANTIEEGSGSTRPFKTRLHSLSTTGAEAGRQLPGGSPTSSLANTETSSDLFFPSPGRDATPQTSSSSLSADSPPSSRQTHDSFRSAPHSQPTFSEPSRFLLSSAQPTHILQASQTSNDNFSSIALNSRPNQRSIDSASQTQGLFSHLSTTILPSPSSSQDSSGVQNVLLQPPQPRSLLASVEISPSRTGLKPFPDQNLPQPLATPDAMGPTKEKASPRSTASTPASARKSVEPGTSFRERIRQVRSTRSVGRESTSSRPPVRQATNVVLGKVTTSARTSSRAEEMSHAVASPISSLKAEYTEVSTELDRPDALGVIPQTAVHDDGVGLSIMSIQQSIEEDTADTDRSNTASQSDTTTIQKSSENEQEVPRIDGVVMPTLPILGPGEHAISLPAEGRIQSIYQSTIISKKAKLLKYIRRRSSNNLKAVSQDKPSDSVEMTALIERLNNTITHIDLCLEGVGTQYSLRSERNATYAKYAGAKFALLEHLIDSLQPEACLLTIVTKPGTIQDLVEDFLNMKQVKCRRATSSPTATEVQPSQNTNGVIVDLLTGGIQDVQAHHEKAALIIAFDSTFDAQDPLIKQLRGSEGQLVPVIYLLTANSSEHVDRCLPTSMPSPQRLQLLVQATYQARRNLGGSPIIIAEESEAAPDAPMDYSDLQKVMKKSPDRRLRLIAERLSAAIKSGDFDANWTLGPMPELEYQELDESPAKSAGARSNSPLSHPGTPSLRKRLLDADGSDSASAKRQRMTPLHDGAHVSNSVGDPVSQLQSQVQKLQIALKNKQEELENEREARLAAEEAHRYVRKRYEDQVEALSGLQNRYETRFKLCHLQKKDLVKLQGIIDGTKSWQERTATENTRLKEDISQLSMELSTARGDLKTAGGDIKALELAREEARNSRLKSEILERSLANSRKDFEFVRHQYQEASTKAAEFASQVSDLEMQATTLKVQASDEKRKLRELNYHESVKRHLERVGELEAETKMREVVMRKLMEENERLKKGRVGVQTRGNSVQPPGSPGLRSRQGSPALGNLGMDRHGHAHAHSGSSGIGVGAVVGGRASVLRHER